MWKHLLVSGFNQEKSLKGAFSVIITSNFAKVKGSFEALDEHEDVGWEGWGGWGEVTAWQMTF